MYLQESQSPAGNGEERGRAHKSRYRGTVCAKNGNRTSGIKTTSRNPSGAFLRVNLERGRRELRGTQGSLGAGRGAEVHWWVTSQEGWVSVPKG